MTTRPMVPANESNILSQYSPAPVVKISPTKKQNVHTTPVPFKFFIDFIHVTVEVHSGDKVIMNYYILEDIHISKAP